MMRTQNTGQEFDGSDSGARPDYIVKDLTRYVVNPPWFPESLIHDRMTLWRADTSPSISARWIGETLEVTIDETDAA